MKHFYNILMLLVLVPLTVVANHDKFKGKHTKEKTVSKEFNVNANAGLRVANSYGSISISTWNQNKTVIDVVIKANGNNEEKVVEKLRQIEIDFQSNAAKVSAVTNFGASKSKWKSWFGSGDNSVSVEVNYTIKLPITNTVDISNDYGTISIDKLEGHAKVHCDYGQLIIGELLAESNALNFDYTNNSSIRYMKSGTINADFSGFKLDKADKLIVNADHTNSELGDVTHVNYNNDHGKISIEKAATVTGLGDHISHSLGTVSEEVNINTDHGSITIERLEASCKKVMLRAGYASVKLGLAPNYSFDFVFNLSYTALKGEGLLNTTKKNESHSSKIMEGSYGKKGSGNSMNVNLNYGSLKLTNL